MAIEEKLSKGQVASKKINLLLMPLSKHHETGYKEISQRDMQDKVDKISILLGSNERHLPEDFVGKVTNALKYYEGIIEEKEKAAQAKKEEKPKIPPDAKQRESTAVEAMEKMLGYLQEPNQEQVDTIASKVNRLRGKYADHPKFEEVEKALSNAKVILNEQELREKELSEKELREKELREQVSTLFDEGKLEEEAKNHFNALTSLADEIEIEEGQIKKKSFLFMGSTVGKMLEGTKEGVKPGCMSEKDYNKSRMIMDYIITLHDLLGMEPKHLEFTDKKLKEIAKVCFPKAK